MDYIIDLNKRGIPFKETYAGLILTKMLTPFQPGYVDLASPAGIATGALLYNYDGAIFASDESRMLAEMGDKTFRLGSVANSYEEIISSDSLLDALEQSFAASAPMCSTCAYEPYCGADPVYHHATQGDYLGRKPLSGFCNRNMAIFKGLLTRMESDPETRRIAKHLTAIEGLVSKAEIEEARRDWDGTCDKFSKYAQTRMKELGRVARVHRDPFEAILPILEADSPLAEYRKISDEVLRLMPDRERYPKAAAEGVRSYLVLRLGMHLGLRQKNLRQLLICPKGNTPSTERRLVDLKRGELRWSEKLTAWEVLIPAIAFKNGNSSYFGNRPFRLVLPDLEGLYSMMDQYIDYHRPRLLADAPDPGTFFIKTVKRTSANAEYNETTFYELWRLTIQRYGVYNPYTGRGAIKGLLPHGPHNIRDVLATHILKHTGSYEQASYAIQDTPEMVGKHYGRFLPQDKAALAAQILNKVWQPAPISPMAG